MVLLQTGMPLRLATKNLLGEVPNLRFLSTLTQLTKPKLKCNILRSNPGLIPQLTYTSQLKSNILRTFSTSSQFLDYYRRPKSTIIGGGVLGRLWSRIPDSVKLFTAIGLSAYLFIFVAVPVFVIVVPPLILGGALFVWLGRFLNKRQMRKRWDAITDSTLVYNPHISKHALLVPSPEQINADLANFEMNRIVDAFWNNEQGISDYFKVKDVDNLALGTLEAVQYSYNSDSVVFADDFQMMVTQQRVLYDKSQSKELAEAILTLKCLDPPKFEDIDPSANITRGLVSIEIIPSQLFAKEFVLKTPSVSTKDHDDDNDGFDDGFINVKGKTTIL